MASSSNVNTSPPTEKKYPYPTEFNVLEFVPKLLSEKNYKEWKELMQRFIERRGLAGLIVGEAMVEPATASQDYDTAWERSDNLVRGWIMATLPEDIRLRVLARETAKDLWTCLEYMFDLTTSKFDEEADMRLTNYRPLYKAAIKGDWSKAAAIIQRDPDAATTAAINHLSETALIVAIKSVGRNHFVGKLLEKMTAEDVLIADERGRTALHYAAMFSNIEGAKMLVQKNADLPNVKDGEELTPLHRAAYYGVREMVIYLMQVTSEDLQLGDDLLGALTDNELYGVPMKSESIAIHHNEGGGREGDIESPANCWITGPCRFQLAVRQRLHSMFWEVAEKLVPHIKYIQEKKIKQHHALELVKVLCTEISKSNYSVSQRIFLPAIQVAARIGIPEVFEQIVLSSPVMLYSRNLDGRSIFQDAILWRREHVYNLIYQTTIPTFFVSISDWSGNNGLHMAALLGHEQKINLKASVPIAVLQMQRELQWFKEVEKFTYPGDKDERNKDGLTPAELFSKTHQDLIQESEHWMKDTATSCTIVAALIATMVFAAAITVPGGNNDRDGHPILSKQKAFIIFGIADALALFSSITSVLMFLLILTSRYAEEDFPLTLPSRLVIGLITLFVSILCTMVTSGAILYLVFGDNKAWFLIPLAALASIPTTLFGALQFPLLIEMIQSTYGQGIFGKKSDLLLL